jgi:hypothetical protein
MDWRKLNWGGGGDRLTSAQPAPARTRGRLSSADAVEYVRVRVNPKVIDTHRYPIEREWVQNIAFLNGNQHYVPVGNGFRPPILQPHRVLYRANLVRATVTRMVSTVMANSVTFRCPSKDWTKKSRDSAYVSEKLFEHLRENVLDWPDILEETLTWAACCGSGFIEIGWDADSGAPTRFYIDENGKAVVGLTADQQRQAEEDGRYEDMPPGEVTARCRSPFQIQWDWSARSDWHQANWGATKEVVDIEELENIYGYAKTKDIIPLEPKSHSLWFDEMLAFMAGSGSSASMPNYITPKDKRRQRCVLVRYFERPNRQNNYRGRFIVAAGDVILTNRDNPYLALEKYVQGGSLPFLKVDWQKRPGSFIGHAVVEDLRNPQFQYNNARARQTEVLNVHSHPAIFINKNAGLPEGALAIEPGVTYPVDMARTGGKVIELGPVPQVPKELAESATRAWQEIQSISSQADPDMSKLPGQIRGAPALNMMIEEKNKSLIPAAKSALKATLRGGRLMLAIGRTHYTTQRTLRYVGEDNAYRVMAFEAADLVTDIRVVGEPEFFHTKSTERAQVLEYVQSGVLDPINNPEDKLTVLKVLAFGNAEEALAEQLADTENQDREWEEMTSDPLKYIVQDEQLGTQRLSYPTQPFDNHAIHARVMLQRMKSSEFRDLDPIARQLLMEHLQEHQLIIEQQKIRQLMLAQAQSGGSAQRGQPSRPKPTNKPQGTTTSG